jgi:hypothetical protein
MKKRNEVPKEDPFENAIQFLISNYKRLIEWYVEKKYLYLILHVCISIKKKNDTTIGKLFEITTFNFQLKNQEFYGVVKWKRI